MLLLLQAQWTLPAALLRRYQYWLESSGLNRKCFSICYWIEIIVRKIDSTVTNLLFLVNKYLYGYQINKKITITGSKKLISKYLLKKGVIFLNYDNYLIIYRHLWLSLHLKAVVLCANYDIFTATIYPFPVLTHIRQQI